MGAPGNRKSRIFFLGFLCFLPKVSFIIGLIIIDGFQENSLGGHGIGGRMKVLFTVITSKFLEREAEISLIQ